MSRSRRGKKAGEDAERLLQEAFGVSEDQLLKDFILAQTEVKDSDIPPGSEDGFERLMAKLEAEVGTSPESEKESSSENIVKLHEEARKPRRLKSIVKVSVAAAAIAVMVVAMGISVGAKREYRYVVREKDSVRNEIVLNNVEAIPGEDESVNSQWANVETQYQRRADLIPNLVNTVKGYASHEKETLEGVVEARSKATQMQVNANDLTPEKLAEYQKAQGAVTSALGKLLAITENYPDLKANQNFLELQAQLEGTENRINVARTNFNNAAQAYNTAIRRFPKSLFASMFGFDKHAYFEAAEGTETAPTVSF